MQGLGMQGVNLYSKRCQRFNGKGGRKVLKAVWEGASLGLRRGCFGGGNVRLSYQFRISVEGLVNE